VDARDVTVTDTAAPDESEFEGPPARFQGSAVQEMKQIRFRCPYCGIAHQAAILPHSPQIAKFKCRQCDHVLDVETRPSAMDSIEQEFDLRLDMKKSAERGKSFSLPSTPSGIIIARR